MIRRAAYQEVRVIGPSSTSSPLSPDLSSQLQRVPIHLINRQPAVLIRDIAKIAPAWTTVQTERGVVLFNNDDDSASNASQISASLPTSSLSPLSSPSSPSSSSATAAPQPESPRQQKQLQKFIHVQDDPATIVWYVYTRATTPASLPSSFKSTLSLALSSSLSKSDEGAEKEAMLSQAMDTKAAGQSEEGEGEGSVVTTSDSGIPSQHTQRHQKMQESRQEKDGGVSTINTNNRSTRSSSSSSSNNPMMSGQSEKVEQLAAGDDDQEGHFSSEHRKNQEQLHYQARSSPNFSSQSEHSPASRPWQELPATQHQQQHSLPTPILLPPPSSPSQPQDQHQASPQHSHQFQSSSISASAPVPPSCVLHSTMQTACSPDCPHTTARLQEQLLGLSGALLKLLSEDGSVRNQDEAAQIREIASTVLETLNPTSRAVTATRATPECGSHGLVTPEATPVSTPLISADLHCSRMRSSSSSSGLQSGPAPDFTALTLPGTLLSIHDRRGTKDQDHASSEDELAINGDGSADGLQDKSGPVLQESAVPKSSSNTSSPSHTSTATASLQSPQQEQAASAAPRRRASGSMAQLMSRNPFLAMFGKPSSTANPQPREQQLVAMEVIENDDDNDSKSKTNSSPAQKKARTPSKRWFRSRRRANNSSGGSGDAIETGDEEEAASLKSATTNSGSDDSLAYVSAASSSSATPSESSKSSTTRRRFTTLLRRSMSTSTATSSTRSMHSAMPSPEPMFTTTIADTMTTMADYHPHQHQLARTPSRTPSLTATRTFGPATRTATGTFLDSVSEDSDSDSDEEEVLRHTQLQYRSAGASPESHPQSQHYPYRSNSYYRQHQPASTLLRRGEEMPSLYQVYASGGNNEDDTSLDDETDEEEEHDNREVGGEGRHHRVLSTPSQASTIIRAQTLTRRRSHSHQGSFNLTTLEGYNHLYDEAPPPSYHSLVHNDRDGHASTTQGVNEILLPPLSMPAQVMAGSQVQHGSFLASPILSSTITMTLLQSLLELLHQFEDHVLEQFKKPDFLLVDHALQSTSTTAGARPCRRQSWRERHPQTVSSFASVLVELEQTGILPSAMCAAWSSNGSGSRNGGNQHLGCAISSPSSPSPSLAPYSSTTTPLQLQLSSSPVGLTEMSREDWLIMTENAVTERHLANALLVLEHCCVNGMDPIVWHGRDSGIVSITLGTTGTSATRERWLMQVRSIAIA